MPGKPHVFYIREKLTELFLDEDYRVEESLLLWILYHKGTF